jgi:hypothetical protein
MQHEMTEYAISFLRESFPRTFSGVKTIPTIGTEIKQRTLWVMME